MDQLKITATANGLNYLPEYLANDQGLFEEQGLRVTAQARDPWDGVLEDLASGAADVALGGIWVPIMYEGIARDLVVIGQLNDRFPMVVVTREPVADFDWSWMRGRTVLVPGQGGTAPYEFTAGLMREAGQDPFDTRFVRDLSTGMLRELFEGGLGDAFVTDLGTAARLQSQGIGHMSCQLADVGGRMPNSVYYVRRDRLDELGDVLGRFLTGIRRGMDQLAAAKPSDVADLVSRKWPESDTTVLLDATAKLIGNGTWDSVRVDRAAYDRWVKILADGGLVKTPVPYDAIVDTRAMDVAEAIVSSPA